MYKRIVFLMGVVLSVGLLLGYGREVLAVRLPEERVRLLSAPILTNSVVPMQELVKLTAADAAAGDQFGFGIATDGMIVAVGAVRADGITGETGAVYLYEAASPWSEITRVYAADGQNNDQFGLDVALSGDVLVVGAQFGDSQVANSGAAYVYYRDHGGPDNWGQVAKLMANDAAANDLFGRRVAIAGDVIVVGAHWDDDNGTDSGSAYVFERNAGGANNWGQTAKLTASDGAFDEGFGAGIAIYEDTIVVGAVRDGAGDQGAAYVFMRDANTPTNWLETTKLTASDATPNSYLGGAIDLNGEILVIGAHRNVNYTGAAYVFEPDVQNPGNWVEVTKLTANPPMQGGNFGWELSLVGERLVVAAPGEAGAQQPGVAYLFSRHAGGENNWGVIDILQASDAASEDSFGVSVAMVSNIVAIGAHRNDHACPANPNCNSGAGYLFGATVDLSIHKEVIPTLAVPGAPVTYTLTVQNQLPYTVTQAVVTDVVPAEIVNPVFIATNIAITPTGSVPFVWQVGPLLPGVTGFITITGTISPDLVIETTIVNTAVITNSADITPTNNSSTAVTQVIIPQINLSASEYVVNEDGGQVMVTAVLSPAQPFLDVTVGYETGDGTALAGEDYTAVSGILTFPAGTTEAQILVPILDDQLVEPDETFSLELNDPAHATLGSIVTTTITILDDDAYPELNLSAAEYTVLENAGQVALTVTLSHSYPEPVSVAYETADGTALAGEDYTAVSSILTFTAGITQAQILVPILDDQLVEGSETFAVVLSSPVNAVLGGVPEAMVLIIDDDSFPLVSLSSDQYVVPEDVGIAVFTVTLSHDYPEPVSLVYETADGTAVAGEDYVPVTGTLTFSPGETLATFTSPIIDDALVEPAETFSISLTGFINALPQPPVTAVVTILDNDEEPPVSSATIYLPLIMRPAPPAPPVAFRVHIGDAIPNRPVVAQGETFYTIVVQIPATLPEGGQFYLSTVPDQVTATAVDDQISFSLANGDTVFTYRYSDHGEAIQPHIVPVLRSLIAAMAGQPVTVRYTDVFGQFVSATTVWLIWTP